MQPRRHARPLWWVLVAALVSVAAAVGALGGFGRRTDLLQLTAPGTMITTGPYQLTFTEVTAQRHKDFDNQLYWQLSAVGTGRTTGNETAAPDTGEHGPFVSKDTRSGEIEAPSGVRYGIAASFTDGARFTPGLPPVPILVDFRYHGDFVPGQTLRFAVLKLSYNSTALLGGQEKTWHRTSTGYEYRLPVKVLPDAQT